MNLLKEGIESGVVFATDASRKITIGGITQTKPVYRIRLDILFYNDLNDRIATWISQYKNEHGGQTPDPANREVYNAIIEKFIIESNPRSINETKENIRQFEQREPAVVLIDGRIIDGNRRFTCLRSLAEENERFNYLEAIIIGDNAAEGLKQIKMLELAIQHGEEGKVDYNPVDKLVGLYHDICETQLLTVNEYARSTNEKPSVVRKRIDTAKLMVEYLEFINAPGLYHIIRDLELIFPLEELQKMLKRCQSNEDAEDLKVCVFTNIFMRTSNDLGRMVRSIKNIVDSPFFSEYIEEQKEIAADVLERLPEKVTSASLKETVNNNPQITQALNRSIEKALLKSQKSESVNRPYEILDNVTTLLSAISAEMFDECSDDDLNAIKEKISNIEDSLNGIRSIIS
jgi:hypothetical protein